MAQCFMTGKTQKMSGQDVVLKAVTVGGTMTQSDSPNWNAWFSRLRLGLWTDTDYYNNPPPRPMPPPPGATAWLPFHGGHIFIAGETGYGKSNTERVILTELRPGIRHNAIEVIGFDAQSGVELQEAHDAGYLKEFYFGKETGEKTDEWPDGKPYEATFADALEKHVRIGMDRTEYMRQHSIKEWIITPNAPGRVILLDEAGQLFRPNIPKRTQNRIVGAIDTMTYQLRKCGYVVVACTQHSNLSQIPIRHGLTLGVAHRMKTQLGYEQVTGNGMDMPHLAPRVKGLAYMSGYNKRILRTQWIPRLPHLRPPVDVVVKSDRMPAVDVKELERIPVYADHVGTVDTLTGEVVDEDSQYEAVREYWSQYR
jgi:Zonular occludens toxin (Zot)